MACILCLFLIESHAPAALAAYPDKEIRLIVPYKAGGQSDLTARKLAEVIQAKKLLSQPVIVINIPGANTLEGLRNVMRAKPDGYTLLLHHSAFVTMKALGQIPMSWHDFEMVGQALEMSNSLVVNLDSHFRTISEFIEAVKKEPGKYRIAIPGLGGVAHLALLDVLVRTGIQDKVEIMPFDGANEAVTALMGGRVDMRTAPNADMARFVMAGEQRVLLVMGDDKLPGIKAPQYAADLGLKNTLILRNGIFAPRGTSEEVRKILAHALQQAVDSDEFQAFAAQQTAQGRFLDAADWAKAFVEDEKTTSNIVKFIVK
ncbi:tripartite tricarboxylate transporter substrate binding protein [Desulfovibrio sp.]|uniref:tripartite tricarboxylate transporter substrate binding protein n=1 Tax=Desulfovibrio sp. TaxID=885 RepID=UPI0025C1B90C|nr:tripartite tricarboxylate transporter substrate binding protein [Desulfovibrio sp.]